MGKFNSDDHYVYYCGQESLRRNGVALIVRKSTKCSTWVQSQKQQNDLCFQSKLLNIIIIQVCAPTSNAEEAEVERFYEDLQDLLELTPKKDVLFITGDWNGKPFQYSCFENPMNSMKRQKDRTLKGELLRSIGAQYATRD